jgi:uncharacterized protein (TIGR03000 family)
MDSYYGSPYSPYWTYSGQYPMDNYGDFSGPNAEGTPGRSDRYYEGLNQPRNQQGETTREEPRLDGSATLIVQLPPDARLTIDGNPTRSASDLRVFTTPPLEAGQDFHYDLKAEIMRDGKTIPTTQRVTVRSGKETRITMQFPTAEGDRK